MRICETSDGDVGNLQVSHAPKPLAARRGGRGGLLQAFVTLWVLADMTEATVTMSNIARADSFEEQFRDPPHEYSMLPFWSWNGRLEPSVLRWQMDQMVEKGVYGAFMHARAGIDSGGTPYFSDGWWEAVAASIEHGAQVGFKTWIYDEDKWPSGAAGGRTLRRNPERNRQKVLRVIESRVSGPCDAPLGPAEARYVVAARITGDRELDPDSLVDLSARSNGERWSCPAGQWVLLSYVFEPFGEGVNYLNRETVRDFLDITHDEYARRFGDQFGQTVPGVFFDEIMNDAGKHPGVHIWAEDLERRFREMKGYDLAPLLPALTYDIGPSTPKIRCAYYDVWATLYEEAWFQQIAEWCEGHGLALTGHTIEELNRYVTQGDYMRTLRRLDIPLTDNEDFRYTWPRTIGSWKPKQVASVAHLYGRPRVGVEALGGAGWCFDLNLARYGINMLGAYGINFFVPHLFHYAQDRPVNMDDWPNSWFFENPYWKYFKTLADHARRLSFMLSSGRHIVDVAVLYPQANQWAGYGPGTTEATVDTLTSALVDVDVIDPPSLMSAEIRDRALCAGGMQYRALIVPGLRCMRRHEVDQIRAFIEAGGVVIVHDRWPSDSMDKGRSDPYVTRLMEAWQARGIGLTSLDDTVDRLAAAVEPDVLLREGRRGALRYQHVQRPHREIYWIMNGARDAGTWRLSFRAVGQPSLWQPEDGSTQPVSAFVREGGRTVCDVQLDRWQGSFLVFDTEAAPSEGGVRITTTNLEQTKTQPLAGGTVTVTGLLPPGETRARVSAEISTGSHSFLAQAESEAAPLPEAIPLDGVWHFLPVGDSLDYDWRVDVDSAELALPVMRVRWEQSGSIPAQDWCLPAYDDSAWRQVKILDTLHPDQGASRYRSCWEGRFISYHPYDTFDMERFFVPQIGGRGLRCRKTFMLSPEVSQARIAVVCETPYRVVVNGQTCAEGQGGARAERFELRGFRPGANTVEVVAENARAILAEGDFPTAHGAAIPFSTDGAWEVSLDGVAWLAAWEYVAPPEAPYGEPEHPFHSSLPDTVWYRQPLPPGTTAIDAPKIEGHWTAWVNGKKLVFRRGRAKVGATPGTSVLAIRATLSGEDHGLLEPVRVRCAATEQPLVSWTRLNLDWYSGRVLYTREFTLDHRYTANDLRLELDLGAVRFCAELWVNGQLTKTRVWPPYRADITDYVHPGVNRVDLVVANLVANRMRWDIFDDAKADLQSRKWHDDNLLRDAWCLESGLLGPVNIFPFRRVTVTLSPH